MAEQEVWGQETRVEVSKLVLSTNKLTDQVIRLLDAITGNFDDLIGQLTEATGAINGGVADLSVIKKDIEESIRKAQEDMGYVYQEFLTESTDIKGDISSLSGSVTQIKDSIEQLSTDSIFLTSKYSQLQGLADVLQDEISLYKSQVGNLQQSVTSVDQHVEVLKAELQNVSEMTQGNAESASNFEALLNELSLRVTKMTEDTVTYTAVAKDLVDKYNALKSIADESSLRANDAILLANQATIEVSALNTSVFGLQETTAEIQSRITEYGSMADEINGKLATGTAEATALKNFLETTTDDINNRLGYISSQIIDANVKVNAINVRLDSITSTLDGISASVGDMNTTVSQRLEEALHVIEDARNIAPGLASSIEDANTSLVNYTQSLAGANVSIDAIFESLNTYKVETDTTYERVSIQLTTLTDKMDSLSTFVDTSLAQVNAANDEMQASVLHVDEVRERVELIANEVETTYLKKVDQAADSALIGGKDLAYLFHDDNAEVKLGVSPTITQIKSDVTAIQTLLGSDNSNLDTLQEIVDFIQMNKATLDTLNVSSIAGLQTALDGKLGVADNAASASKWNVARKIALSNALSGFVDIDGSGDVVLDATITSMDKVPGLVDQLATKMGITDTAVNSVKLNGIEAARFFFGDDETNVKAVLASSIDGLTQSGFYKTTDTNLSIIHMQRDASNAVRIWWDPATNYLYYKYKASGVWSTTNFRVLSNASRIAFNKIDDVPVFATRANTWDEVTGKPTTFTATAHMHLWDEITGKPSAFIPVAHTHIWDEVTGKPTTFTPSPHNHYSVISEGLMIEQTGMTEATYAGLSIADAVAGTAWVDGTRVGNIINAKGNTSSQLMISPNASNSPSIYVRGKLGEAESWSTWAKVLTTDDVITWDSIGSKPTTLAGFGITDGAPLSHVGAGGTAHSEASTSVAGFMSAADKTKLDGIAAGANAYVHPTGDGNLHVPITGTNSDGYVLKAGATAGSISWGQLTAADVGALPSTWVPNFSDINSKPTTLGGYGITDAQPLDPDLTAIAGLAGTTGLLKKTAANTWALDTNTYLTNNKTITISGDATGTGSTAISLVLANSGATAGTYKSVTVDSKGRVTSGTNPTTLAGYGITDAQALDADLTAIAALSGTSGLLKKTAANTWSLDTNAYITGNQSIAVSGDAYGSGATSIALTLANSGVTAGTYKSVTVDAKGRVTAGTNPTTLAGYDITDATPSSHIGSTGTAHGVATTSVAGFMSSSDKTKLDGIATGANAYTHPTSGVTSGTYKSVTVNAQGHITAGTNPTTLAGYGITDAMQNVAATGLDVNAFPSSSLYKLTGAGWANIPSGAAGNGDQVLNAHWDVNASTQLYLPYNNNTALAWRRKSGGSYSGWMKLYHEGNKPTAADVGALPSAGGTVTGQVYNSLSGTPNTFLGGKLSSESGTLSLDAYYYAFVTSPKDVHLCYNSKYQPSTGWVKYDNANTSGKIVISNSGFQYVRSDAGSTDPNQYYYDIWHAGNLNPIAKNAGNILGNSSFGVGFLTTGDAGAPWIAAYFGKNGGANQVVVGELGGSAVIGAHTAAKTAWADLYIGMQSTGGANKATHISMPYARVIGNPTSFPIYHTGNLSPLTEGGLHGTLTLDNWIRTTGSTGWLNVTHGGGMYMSDDTWVRTSHTKKFHVDNTSPDAIYTLGGIAAVGDISARYSDKRLKKNLTKVNNALDTVSKLTAYKYQANELANELAGYDTNRWELGLLAQDVEAVAPEVISLAPFDINSDLEGNITSKSGENYLTIKYERLVPLLVEAIKELSEEVKYLRQQVEYP